MIKSYYYLGCIIAVAFGIGAIGCKSYQASKLEDTLRYYIKDSINEEVRGTLKNPEQWWCDSFSRWKASRALSLERASRLIELAKAQRRKLELPELDCP